MNEPKTLVERRVTVSDNEPKATATIHGVGVLFEGYAAIAINELQRQLAEATSTERVSIDTNNIGLRAMVSAFIERRTKSTFDWIDSEELLEAIVEQALEATQ